nr:hypothetical protein [Tanacetum cinerariifolium]
MTGSLKQTNRILGCWNNEFRKFLKDIDMSDKTTMFEGFKDGCYVGENCAVGSELCVKRVAKDPCDPAIGLMPGSSKWKAYGSEHVWKQALLAKEAMVLKVNDDLNDNQSVWKKKRKMHPDMYSGQPKNINSRRSQRLVSIKETQSTLLTRKLNVQDHSDSSSTKSRSDVENKGYFLFYQAEIPEWTPETYKCETKWLRTRVWPLEETVKQRSHIERERIGKGRQSSCGCKFKGSLECVRFHISEKRYRVRLELGPAFANWKFDTMGEEVSLYWTMHEEKKFAELIKLNPESSGRSFARFSHHIPHNLFKSSNQATMSGKATKSGDNLSLRLTNLLKNGFNNQPQNPKLSDNLQINLKLDNQNYTLWTRMIRVAIGGKYKTLLSHLTSDPPEQSSETYEQWEQEDLIVFSCLIQNIKPTLAEQNEKPGYGIGDWGIHPLVICILYFPSYFLLIHNGQGERECIDTLSWLKYVTYEEGRNHSTQPEDPNVSFAQEASNLIPGVSNTHSSLISEPVETTNNTSGQGESVQKQEMFTTQEDTPIEQNEYMEEQETFPTQEDTSERYALSPRANRGVPTKRYSQKRCLEEVDI